MFRHVSYSERYVFVQLRCSVNLPYVTHGQHNGSFAVLQVQSETSWHVATLPGSFSAPYRRNGKIEKYDKITTRTPHTSRYNTHDSCLFRIWAHAQCGVGSIPFFRAINQFRLICGDTPRISFRSLTACVCWITYTWQYIYIYIYVYILQNINYNMVKY